MQSIVIMWLSILLNFFNNIFVLNHSYDIQEQGVGPCQHFEHLTMYMHQECKQFHLHWTYLRDKIFGPTSLNRFLLISASESKKNLQAGSVDIVRLGGTDMQE